MDTLFKISCFLSIVQVHASPLKICDYNSSQWNTTMHWIFLFLFACSTPEKPTYTFTEEQWRVHDGALRILDFPLGGNPLQTILSSHPKNSIHTLHLENTKLTPQDAYLISVSPALHKLTYLFIPNNVIESRGLTYLSNADFLPNIRELDLENTGISTRGLLSLLNQTSFRPQKLNLSGNTFDEKVIDALNQSPHITELLLRNSKLNEGSSSLLLRYTKSNILDISNNEISFPAQISESINTLYLLDTRLKDDEFIRLVQTPAPGLKKIFFGRVFVSDEVLLSITKAPWFPQLEVLSLQPLNTSKETEEAIKKAYGSERWLKLDVVRQSSPPKETQ